MADNKNLQSTGFEPGHHLLRMSGYAAAAAFCAVSVGANLQFGLSLGRNPIDKATYAVASIAADFFKIAAPVLALSLWSKRFRILAIGGLVLWLGCVAWSMASAVGFVLSSRGDAIAERAAEAATRHGWEAKVERAESQLATLGKHRPPDVIKAELASAAVPLHIWRRSHQCLDLTLEESRLACAPVLGLRKELAAAEAAERLEAQLVAGRTQLATASVVGSVADPQASALARLTVPMKGPSARALPCCWPASSRWVRRWALRWSPWRLHPTHNRLRRLGAWRVHQTRRVRKRRPGVRQGPRCTSAGFRPGTRPAVARNSRPARRALWQVRGTSLHCQLPRPCRVCRCAQSRNCPPGQTPLSAGPRPGSTWIVLAASRRVTPMPISAVGRELRVSSPVPKHASAGISLRASSISVE
jgi:hypothetical protein